MRRRYYNVSELYSIDTSVVIHDPTSLDPDDEIEVEVRISFTHHPGDAGSYYQPPEPDSFEINRVEILVDGKYTPCPNLIADQIERCDYLDDQMRAEVNAYYD